MYRELRANASVFHVKRMFDSGFKKRRTFGLICFAILLGLFLTFNRIPKLDIIEQDLEGITASTGSSVTAEQRSLEVQNRRDGTSTVKVDLVRDISVLDEETAQHYPLEGIPHALNCFQGFCVEEEPTEPLLTRWWDFSITYLQLITVGMIFAFLVAGLMDALILPNRWAESSKRRGWGSLRGIVVGPALTLCSACIVPVAASFRKRGAGIGETLALTQGSSTMNIPGILMVLMVFAPVLAVARVVMSIVATLTVGPVAARVARVTAEDCNYTFPLTVPEEGDTSWFIAIRTAIHRWSQSSLGYVIRIGPIMVIAGFASGLAIQWLTPGTVESFLGNHFWGVLLAATIGILINVPLLFEIPLVAALLLVGMGNAPGAVLLFTAASGGPITYWGLSRVIPKKAVATFALTTWSIGVAGGLIVLYLSANFPDLPTGIQSHIIG